MRGITLLVIVVVLERRELINGMEEEKLRNVEIKKHEEMKN